MDTQSLKRSPAARIRYLMEMFGFSSDYAMQRGTGVNRSTINKILTRDRIGPKSARQLADALNISAAWVESGFGDPPGPKSTESAPKEPTSIQEEAHEFILVSSGKPPDLRAYALISKAENTVSAGGGALVLSEVLGEHHAFRLDWINHVATARDNLVLMDVEGDSMQPTLASGDSVLIDQGRKRIRAGQIYALRVDDLMMVKRLDLLADGRVRVISDNPQYPPYELAAGDVHVIGQVIWFARTWIQ